MNALDTTWPTWLRDVISLLAVHPHFVVAGNVRDWYQLPDPETPVARGVSEALATALGTQGYEVVLGHDVVDGYRMVREVDAGWATVRTLAGRDLQNVPGHDLAALGDLLRAFARPGNERVALVLDMASGLLGRSSEPDSSERQLFRIAEKVSQQAVRLRADGSGRTIFNPVFWVVEREHDLPAWFTGGNPGVRSVTIPQPDLEARSSLGELLLAPITDSSERKERARDLAAAADGLGARALFDIAALFRDQAIPYEDADDAVRTYKVGVTESPWRKGAVADRLRGNGADLPSAHTFLESKVLGQPHAVTKSVDILTRAVLGLSGAQGSNARNKPRGVLFFVGPTGTGKTELAKSITELVFGSTDAYVRFDMSEFAAEHAGDRLIGSPPGYVGFDAGGELTNAVRTHPYSLLLFDEVEKAHPLILDKFLQVLEDGRLTDGRGTTVHFSETLIVFTSNIGTFIRDGDRRVSNITTDDSYPVIEQKVRKAVSDYFSMEINRPELLNRIGDNIVVFDFIRPEVATRIVDLQVNNVLGRVAESMDVSVKLDDEARNQLYEIVCADLSFGGRGIGNLLEAQLVNPLARALFARSATAGTSLVIKSMGTDDQGPTVILE